MTIASSISKIEKLNRFISALDRLLSERVSLGSPGFLDRVGRLMSELIREDDWLPDSYTVPHPQYYQQYCLHRDPQNRFSVVSFVWGPGQATPIHDHTIWGVIGMLRGQEHSQRYRIGADGVPVLDGPLEVLSPGDTSIVSPHHGDIHKVLNAYHDQVSISIHVYGGDIGATKRHVFPPEGGPAKEFISGYSTPVLQ